jgi:pyruvate dehydrogenase E1 component
MLRFVPNAVSRHTAHSSMLRLSPLACGGKQGVRHGSNLGGVNIISGEQWTPRPASALKDASAQMDSAPAMAADELAVLKELETKTNWLMTLMIDNANNVRPKRDGLKVGGHQASSASMVTILTALYLRVLRPQDRVAVKPHAGPIFHVLQYLMGRQTLDNMKKFRSFGGIQPYPSKTKDLPEVDLSTGSVGLGAAATTFCALIEQLLRRRGLDPKAWPGTSIVPTEPGRMIALVGDAELDEGNVFECLRESWKLDIRNNWYIIDYNRQSLDKIMDEHSFRVIERMFRMNGWQVITLKYGKLLQDAFAKPGGESLWKWINACDNGKYSALTFRGGAAWREALMESAPTFGDDAESFMNLVASYNDDALESLMSNLGGHCFETLFKAFDLASQSDKRTCFIAYTIKGYGLPLAGHRDNHGLFLKHDQVKELQLGLGLTDDNCWEPFVGMKHEQAAREL